MRIEHHLLGLPGESREEAFKSLKKVISHQKALEQCLKIFEAYPDLERAIHSDTAGAAKIVREGKDPAIGAIASREAAALYGLQILRENIEDDPFNFTRFVVVARGDNLMSAEESSRFNKCSLLFCLPHVAGSLASFLARISARGLNLTRIESRPIAGRPFEYNFYVDIEGDEGTLEGEIPALRESTTELRVLGIYRAGENLTTRA